MLYIQDDGYATKYAAQSVREKAALAANLIEKLMAEFNADTVVVSGNSGISLAHAALMLIDFPLVLCRKNKDNSHGTTIEGVLGHTVRRYIVLDDFVSSGATVRRICDTMFNSSRTNPAICVAVAQYVYKDPSNYTTELTLDKRRKVEWQSDNDEWRVSIPVFGVGY